jgi:hypothetical protein
MKRTLISFDNFKKIEENSLTKAQQELIEAAETLAKTLGLESLELHTFGESDVTYQSNDGNFIHATYTMTDNEVILENLQILVIEEESEKNSARETISKMIDNILENKDHEANSMFENYMSMPFVRRELMVNEAFKVTVSKPTGKKSPLKGRKQDRSLVAKRARARKATLAAMSPSERKKLGRHRDQASSKISGGVNPRWRVYARKIKPKTMKEWCAMCENVLGYIDFKTTGAVLNESAIKTDERGNVVAIALPTQNKRNEGKIISMNFKTMDTELKVLRSSMKKISEDQVFVKAMADLKRYNNISDNTALEETLEAIVSRWPNLLYISETELAEQITLALESASLSNYDDATCSFMAEAILRTAHNAFTDKVRKIGQLAGAQSDVSSECSDCEDSYKEFSSAAQHLFDQLDESATNELNIFSDLYKALHEVHRIAAETGDEATRIEVADFMRECSSILNGNSETDMELAEAIADYLADLLEAAEEHEEGWGHGVEVSATGEHPMTKWNAKQNAVASNNTGGWKDAAPASDGKNYDKGHADEMGYSALSNLANDDTWPNMNNPYVPKAVNAKMKEKNVVDDSEGLGDDRFSNTWPGLNNPMSLKPVMPKPVV